MCLDCGRKLEQQETTQTQQEPTNCTRKSSSPGIPSLVFSRQRSRCEATVYKIRYSTYFLIFFSAFGLQRSGLGVIIFTGNSIFSPHLTALSDTACLAPRQKQHLLDFPPFFFFSLQTTKNKASWLSECFSMFLFWNWRKKKKKMENNVLGQAHIIVENNGRNFYGTFKEKRKTNK